MYYIIFSLCLTAVFAVISYRKSVSKWNNLLWIVTVMLLLMVINFFGLPVLAPWGFHGVWIEAFLVSILGTVVYFSKYELNRKKLDFWRFAPALIAVVAAFVCFFQSAECFHASSYYQRLKVTEVADTAVHRDFNAVVSPISVSKMISVDAALARKVAEDKLGENIGLGSKVEVGNMTIQSITGSFTINNGKKLNFDNDVIWVAPLEHRSFRKWLLNDVTPGYLIVDATDATKRYLVTEVNGQPLKIKYLESGCFDDDIERHIKMNGFVSKGLNDHCFEIDSVGRPYWVLSTYVNTIGFGGEESDGVITVDAQTGQLNAYSVDEAPSWVDRIQPQDFVEDQIRCWGEYKKGWRNSFMAQDSVRIPTPGTTLVYSQGRSYWYTGIQSAGSDNGTNGFMLVDTRTKEAKYYHAIGVNEKEAMRIAEDQPFAKTAQYTANFPVLYNVRGIPTYFMIMKGSSGNVVGYCFLAMNNRQAVGCGASKQDAESAYLRMLRKTQSDTIKDGAVQKETKSYVVRGIVQENNLYYLLFEEERGVEFTGSTEFFPELKWTKVGDTVNVSFGRGESKVIPLDFFDNVNFEI